MEKEVLHSKLHDLKRRNNILFNFNEKLVSNLANELKEDEECLFIAELDQGIISESFILLTNDMFYIIRNDKVINKLDINTIELEHIEIEEYSKGKLIIKNSVNSFNLSLYNLDIKKLISLLKHKNPRLNVNSKFIPSVKKTKEELEEAKSSLLIKWGLFLLLVAFFVFLFVVVYHITIDGLIIGMTGTLFFGLIGFQLILAGFKK